MLSIGSMLRITRRGRRTDYAAAGVFAGLATATHYLASISALGIVGAHLETRRRENRPLLTALADGRIYLAGGVSLFAFFCGTPYLFLDPTQTAQNYAFEKWSASGFLPYARGWRWLLLHVMPDSLGLTLLIFLSLAVVWAIFHPRTGTLTLLALTAVTFLSLTIGRPALMFRFALVPLLVMALLAGVFAADLMKLASMRFGTGVGIPLLVCLFALVLSPSLARDVQLDWLLAQPDTRRLARLWIQSHVPPQTVIAATDYDLVWNSYGEPQLPAIYKFVPMRNLNVLRAVGFRWVFSDSLPGLEQYSPGPSSAEQEGLDSEATLVLDINPIKEGAPMPVLDPNDAFYVPFQHISSMTNPGPRMRIWELNSR
jgi:hypothetical protein